MHRLFWLWKLNQFVPRHGRRPCSSRWAGKRVSKDFQVSFLWIFSMTTWKLLTFHRRVVRYEDFSLAPDNSTREIFQFYGLSFDKRVSEFLDTHTKGKKGGDYSTFRDSKSVCFKWVEKLPFNDAKSIQDSCNEAMRLWGYKAANNEKELKENFNPLLPLTGFDSVWDLSLSSNAKILIKVKNIITIDQSLLYATIDILFKETNRKVELESSRKLPSISSANLTQVTENFDDSSRSTRSIRGISSTDYSTASMSTFHLQFSCKTSAVWHLWMEDLVGLGSFSRKLRNRKWTEIQKEVLLVDLFSVVGWNLLWKISIHIKFESF